MNDPTSELVERASGACDEEGDELVDQGQLIGCYPEKLIPGGTNLIAARRDQPDLAASIERVGAMRGYHPERHLASERRVEVFGELHLARVAAKDGALDGHEVQVLPLHFYLDDNLLVTAGARPGWRERSERGGIAHLQEAIEADFGEAYFRRVDPCACPMGDGEGLISEELLGKLIELAHEVAASSS